MNLKVYCAGKVKAGSFRDALFGNRCMSDSGKVLLKTSGGYYTYMTYNGPIAMSCDHGCFHKPNSHGLADPACQTFETTSAMVRYEFDAYVGFKEHNKMSVMRDEHLSRCRRQIMDSDLMLIYLESPLDCYGTLLEMGIAMETGTAMLIYGNITEQEESDLWFVLQSGIVKELHKPFDAEQVKKDIMSYSGVY